MTTKNMATKTIFVLLLFMLGISAAHAQQTKKSRDDSIKYACLAAGQLGGGKADDAWCQCQNDYYANLLTDSDWNKYTNDYYALLRTKNSQKSTPANSYARYVSLGDSHCRTCLQNDYKGCLDDDGSTPSTGAYARVLANLRDGRFGDLANNILFKNFFVDYVIGYSAFCGDRINNWVERTVVRTEWTSTNHVWWQSDQSTTITRVDKRLYDRYLSYEEQASDAMIGNLIGGFIEARRKQQLPTKLFGETVKRIVEPVIFMRGHMQNRCNAPDVRAAYENLHRFSAGQAAFVNPDFAIARAKAAQQRQQRINDVMTATKQSRERSIAIVTERRRIDALKPKKQFTCEDNRKQGLAEATTPVNSRGHPGSSFGHLAGGWRGTFNGEDMELAVWAYPSGTAAIGFSYFPKYDCLMSVIVNGESRRRPGLGPAAHLGLRMFSPNWRPNNCESMVAEDRDREIHFFDARGFLTFEPNADSFTWSPYVGKLSRHAPQSCDNVDVEFKAGKVSASFHHLLQRYDYPDKRAVKMPATFLEDIH